MGDTRAWDRAMMARIRVGDETALAAVYDRHAALVHGAAMTLIGPDQARDITQEVFLHLWHHPDRFDPDRGSLRTFLALMARRRAIDDLRRSGRRTAREARAGAAPIESDPDVADTALAHLASERVREAVAQLPPEQRRAIELAYFEGLTYRDVARVTGQAEGTAKSRLRLALQRLARDLQPDTDRVGEPRWT